MLLSFFNLLVHAGNDCVTLDFGDLLLGLGHLGHIRLPVVLVQVSGRTNVNSLATHSGLLSRFGWVDCLKQ